MHNSQHLQALQKQLDVGQLTLFIGADLPQEITSLPSRADLARELARHKGLNESLPLAQVAELISNRWEFTSFICEALDPPGKSPQRFHRDIVDLVEAHQIRTLITTAYDDLLAWAFREANVGINLVVDNDSMAFIRPKRPTLIKLYGDAQQPNTIVITDSDHFALLHDPTRRQLVDEVKRAFSQNTMFFLGYNLSDPDFLFLFSQIAGNRFARVAYAVWPDFPDAIVRMWQDRNVLILEKDPFGILSASGTISERHGRLCSTTGASTPQPSPTLPSPPSSSAPLPQINVSINIFLTEQDRTILQQVYRGFKQVLVEKQLGGGYSGARVLLALPVTKDGRHTARKVTKLGHAIELRRERDRFERYVGPNLPFCVARVESETYYEQGEQSGLNYVFVGDSTLGAAMTLEEYYFSVFPDGVERLVKTLNDLLDKSLGQMWYGQCAPLVCFFAAEYSRQLVEHLRLRLRPASSDGLWPVDRPPIKNADYRPIEVDAIPHEHEAIQPGILLSIEGLVVTRIKRNEATLEDPGGQGIVVGVRFAPDSRVVQGLDFGSRVHVRGEVAYNRRDRMEEIVADIFPDPPIKVVDESIQLPCAPEMHLSLAYPNPLRVYPEVLSRVLKGRKSYVHGDLHLRNVLVDTSGKGWLIDFAKVEERHNLFDFIKLEASVRTWELSHDDCAFALCDYLQFEEAVESATLGMSVAPPQDPHLRFAYEAILAIRRTARKYMGPEPDFRNEYFPALFLYCLGITKYYPNEGTRTARLAFATTCVLSKYVLGYDERGCLLEQDPHAAHAPTELELKVELQHAHDQLAMKIEFYVQVLKEGRFDQFALLLADNPSEVKEVLAHFEEERDWIIRQRWDLFKNWLFADDAPLVASRIRRFVVGLNPPTEFRESPAKLRSRLINALLSVPAAAIFQGRAALLSGLPPNVVAALNRDENSMVDLTNIVTQLDGLGCLASGDWPLLILIDNALQHVKGAQVGQDLEAIREALVDCYGGGMHRAEE